MALLLRSVRALILEPKPGFPVTVPWPDMSKSSDVEKLMGFLEVVKNMLRALVVEMTPGFRATVPMKNPTQADVDISIHVLEDEIALPGDQRGTAQRREIRGPPDQMGDICLRLHNGDVAAATAVICHAWGEEMPLPCATCKGGPFGKCVTVQY